MKRRQTYSRHANGVLCLQNFGWEKRQENMVHHVGVVNGRWRDNTRMHHLTRPGRES